MYSRIIFLNLFYFMVVGIDSQCTCGQNLGVHCGDRVKDGYLEGSCELNRIYECLVENNTANEGGICTHCIKGQSPGTDKCLTENELPEDCICGDVLGTHCGDRMCYLFGNCKSNGYYRCPSAYFPAQFLGICNSCVNYMLPGLDYCAVRKINK